MNKTLAQVRPNLIKEWHVTKNRKLTPYNVTYGSSRKVWWQCKACEWEWKATVYHRAIRGQGCRYCSGRK